MQNKAYQQINLPEPSSSAIENSLELIEHIKQKIDLKGNIDFATYMHDALYTPKLGYYTGISTKIGEKGDFITAPEISPLFSETISQQLSQIIKATPDAVILEIGAGSGKMAANILKTLKKEKNLPKAYWILEPSSDLQARQLETIQNTQPELISHIKWLNQLPTEKFNGVIICNEVIDAMPVHAIKLTQKGPIELGVTIDAHGQKFTWCELKNINSKIKDFIKDNKTLNQRLSEIKDKNKNKENDNNSEFYTEINIALKPWLKDITKNLNIGAAIFLDYGESEKYIYSPDKNQGSLRCFYQHRVHNNPFVYPGLQDITADVNFTQLATYAYDLGFDISGYCTQAMFLAGCGITDRLAAHMNELSDTGILRLNNQMRTIISPNEMGEKIKVLTISKKLDLNFIGYKLNNSVNIL
jgi:SAM-dependent MidA family methyltransferase